MHDLNGRTIDYVRLSITDKCNLRCVYCMPEGGVPEIPHEDILSYEELVRLIRILGDLGFRHVRLTGGEPLVRRGWLDLISQIHAQESVETIGVTTNGILLKGHAAEAKARGLTHVNISLDTLNAETYRHVTRLGELQDTLDALYECVDCGLKVKVNAVPVAGVNDGDLAALAGLAKEMPIDVRFIELMPIGFGASLTPIPNDEIQHRLEAVYGPMDPDDTLHGYGPAGYLKPNGFKGSIGFISALSHEFCDRCNRVRITPEGRLKLCLNHQSGMDLRELLRSGMSDDALRQAVHDCILHKPDRHGFRDPVADREERRMNQIGG